VSEQGHLIQKLTLADISVVSMKIKVLLSDLQKVQNYVVWGYHCQVLTRESVVTLYKKCI
jgi:hypothetical protein